VSLTPALNVTSIDVVGPVGEGEGVGEGDSDGDGEGDGDSEGDSEGDGEGVGEGDSDDDGEGDGDSEGDGEGEGELPDVEEAAKAKDAGGPMSDASKDTTTATDRTAVTAVCLLRDSIRLPCTKPLPSPMSLRSGRRPLCVECYVSGE